MTAAFGGFAGDPGADNLISAAIAAHVGGEGDVGGGNAR